MIRRHFNLVLAMALVPVVCGCAIFFPDGSRTIAIFDAPGAAGVHAQSTVFGGMLFTSGVFPGDPANGVVVPRDITAQTNRVLDTMESVLKGAGCTLKDVVKVNVYLADARDSAKMGEAMAARFGDNRPARTTGAMTRFPGPVLLEADFVARLPDGKQ